MTAKTAAINTLSFEAAMEELESIIRNLENGKTSLEDSISAYERGVALKLHCETKLKDAQMKIDKLVIAPDGSMKTAPLDE